MKKRLVMLVLLTIVFSFSANAFDVFQQWNRTFGGTGTDVPFGIVNSSDGGIFISGYTSSYGAGSDDFWLLRVNSSGSQVWNRTFGGTLEDRAFGVVGDSTGGIFISGRTVSYGAGFSYDFWLLRVNSSGSQVWNKT